VHFLLAANLLWASSTTTTVYSVHNGVALPAARVVVIGVPVVLLSGFWWLRTRRGK
jgi:hypothetical protein